MAARRRVNRKRALGIGIVAVMVAAALWYCFPYIQGEMEYERVRRMADMASSEQVEQVETDGPAAADSGNGDANMARVIDFDSLTATNPDTIGWIWVPGTPIDYPVVQAPADDPTKYLHTTFLGSVSWPNNEGTIYLEADAAEHGFSSTAPLLYGHYQLNNSMFSAWSKNYEPGHMDGIRDVYIYTPKGNIHVRLFAANKVNATVERVRTDFADLADLNSWLDERLGESEVVLEDPSDVTQLWTFCVCSYDTWKNQRTLSYGYTVEDTRPAAVKNSDRLPNSSTVSGQ